MAEGERLHIAMLVEQLVLADANSGEARTVIDDVTQRRVQRALYDSPADSLVAVFADVIAEISRTK